MDCEEDCNSKQKKAIFVGPWGGPGGNYWDDGIYSGVRAILLTYGDCIDSIRILYDKKGTPVWSKKHGGQGGCNAEVKLNFPNEYLTGVNGYYQPMDCNDVIRSLTFRSNFRTFGPFGQQKGKTFSLPMEGGKIVGFRGRSGTKNLDCTGLFDQELAKVSVR